MRNGTGLYMIITIILGCLTHLFSMTSGWSIDSQQQREQLNLLSSVLSNSGGYFTASFLYAVPGWNNSIDNDEWSCHKLFDFTGATSATCNWIDKTTVRGVLGPSPQLQPGDNITLLETSSSVLLSPPVQIQMPVVIMTVAAVVKACDDLLIDLSASWGHLGRPWVNVAWTVTLLNNTDTNRSSGSSNGSRLTVQLVDYLTKYFDPITARVTVPLHMWLDGSADLVLSLTASLTNYLQKSSSDTRVVMILGDRDSGSVSSGSSGDDLLATRYLINTSC